MEPNQQPQGQQMQIKFSDETLKGFYSNNIQVFHTKEEFVLDFMNVFPPTGILGSRVVISPGHMKRLISALSTNLQNYEKNFGEVKEAEPQPKIGFHE